MNKKSLFLVAPLTLLLGFPLAPWGHSAPPSSTLMFSLSPESDGAQTRISWSFSGPIVDSSVLSRGSWGGLGADFSGAFNSSYFTGDSFTFFPATGAGSFYQINPGTSVQITQINIEVSGSSRFIALTSGDTTSMVPIGYGGGGIGGPISYTAGTDSSVINVPFTAFNAGTWTSPNNYFLQNVDSTPLSMNFIATVAPEPSAISLLAVGLGVVLRRRRRTV